MKKPLVSIICLAFNHEKYIREALDGFVMQETNFDFEIIIHDDASTDNTVMIIKEYEKKYPELFNNIYQTENQYTKKEKNIWYDITFPAAIGKYIALCEGDDYWTDPLKLQKQVDFLENNTEYSMCYTSRLYFKEKENKFIKNIDEKTLKIKDILEGIVPFTQTILFKNYKDFNFKLFDFKNQVAGDRILSYFLSLKGSIKMLPDVTGVYRFSGSGLWSVINQEDLAIANLESLSNFHLSIGLSKNNKFIFKQLFTTHIFIMFEKKSFFKRIMKILMVRKKFKLGLSFYLKFVYVYLLKKIKN